MGQRVTGLFGRPARLGYLVQVPSTRRSEMPVLAAFRAGGWLMGNDEWVDRDSEMGVWEHFGRPLTVGELRQSLHNLAADLVVTVDLFDTSGALHALVPMHIDLRGADGRATSLSVTVVAAEP